MQDRPGLVSWLPRACIIVGLLTAACAPAAPPSPTAAPPKPAAEKPAPAAAPPKAVATAAPAKPAAQPTAKPPAKPAFDERAVADFYKGKTIRLIVGASAGGGYDTYSRLIARHIGKYIPGTPNLIVENMPGAGFLLVTNHLYNVAPKDGTAIGNFGVGVAVQQLLGTSGIEFDAAKFRYLGMPTTDTSTCVATKTSGFKSLTETIGPNSQQFIVGGNAPGNSLEDEPKVLQEALGANMKIVSGYGGTSKVRLAMDQGEVDGMCGWSWESIRATALEKVQSGEYVIISQNVEKAHKDLPKVPVAYEMAKTDEARQLIHFGLTLVSHVQRQYAVPPEVPADRVEALREAFTKTVADKEFLAEAEKAKLSIEPLSGEEAQKLVAELLAMPADIKAKLKKIWQP